MFKIEDDIELGKDEPDEYKFRYYKKYYHSEINQNKMIKHASFKYLEGLVWVAKYYFKYPFGCWISFFDNEVIRFYCSEHI